MCFSRVRDVSLRECRDQGLPCHLGLATIVDLRVAIVAKVRDARHLSTSNSDGRDIRRSYFSNVFVEATRIIHPSSRAHPLA